MESYFNTKQLSNYKKDLKIKIDTDQSTNKKYIKEIINKLAKLYEVKVVFNYIEKCYGSYYPEKPIIYINLDTCKDVELSLITFFHELTHHFQSIYCDFCWYEGSREWQFEHHLKFERTACRVSRILFLHHITNIYPNSELIHSYRTPFEIRQFNNYIRFNTNHCLKLVNFLSWLGFKDKTFAKENELYSRHSIKYKKLSITINHTKDKFVLLTTEDRLELSVNGTTIDTLIGYFIRNQYFNDIIFKQYFTKYI